MNRLPEIDRVRGLAILLMIVDHVLVVMQPDSVIRFTLTRAAMPLFCVLAGTFLTDRFKWHRWLYIAGCGVVLSLPGVGVQGKPDILLLLAGSFVVATAWPSLVLMCFAFLQPATWRIGWGGYEPGLVLGFVLVGRLLPDVLYKLYRAGSLLPNWVAVLGRYPLTIYCVHLLTLGWFTNP